MSPVNFLTHWGWETHICVTKLTIIGSNNGLSPGRRQAIIWTSDGILLIWPSGTNFSEMLSRIHIFWFKKMHLKMSSGYRRPFCLGLNVLTGQAYPDLLHNFPDLWLEAHVQHSVGLIQNQVCAAAKVGLASFKEVNQTSWCGDTDLCSTFQVPDLWALRGTTIHTHVAHTWHMPKLCGDLRHLLGQFTCWHQAQTLK